VFPNLICYTYLASRIRRLKFGCGFNIVPMWHPFRPPKTTPADILTGGRVIFGIGRGYHTREVETFGAPMLDNAANMELFEEQMEVIFKAFNEESFSHQGKHYTLPPRVPYRGYELPRLPNCRAPSIAR
jgi:alkanesulfonate monooxygenase SsuD/methylene tetrahydromethanopterin reductase-like flavin-dependent oxidoreductase (luciferase family)